MCSFRLPLFSFTCVAIKKKLPVLWFAYTRPLHAPKKGTCTIHFDPVQMAGFHSNINTHTHRRQSFAPTKACEIQLALWGSAEVSEQSLSCFACPQRMNIPPFSKMSRSFLITCLFPFPPPPPQKCAFQHPNAGSARATKHPSCRTHQCGCEGGL